MQYFNQYRPSVPQNKDNLKFMWVADYGDSYLPEVDIDGDLCKFSNIDKEALQRFGLIGEGARLFFDAITGTFFLVNRSYDLSIVVDDVEYPLTLDRASGTNYRDIITYKMAYTDYSMQSGVSDTCITGYAFGYKIKKMIEDLKLSIQITTCIEYGRELYMKFDISSSKSAPVELRIKAGGEVIDSCALKVSKKRQSIEWVVKGGTAVV